MRNFDINLDFILSESEFTEFKNFENQLG